MAKSTMGHYSTASRREFSDALRDFCDAWVAHCAIANGDILVGYELHITRNENWFDDAGDITLEQWLAFVGGDSEMRHDGLAEAPVGGGKTLRIEGEDISVWTAYSGGEGGRNTAWLTWRNGNIVAKNPDEEIRQKMWRIAQFFDAKVQGDDGELYGKDGEMVEVSRTTRNESRSDTPAASLKSPWWRFW